jgi:uncharacterized protein (TIGR00266 family)
MYVQSRSFLATSPAVDLHTEVEGSPATFSGAGLFLLELTGTGPVFLSSYGALRTVELDAGESYTVDSGHVVGFESSVEYDTERIGGLASSILSGEGHVCNFEGPGTVWMQTRSTDDLVGWLDGQLSVETKSDPDDSGYIELGE